MQIMQKFQLPDKIVFGVQLFLGFWFVLMIIFSKYATSMSIIGFAALGFYYAITHFEKSFSSYLLKLIGLNARSYGFLALTFVFWITVLGYFNSEDTSYWLSRVRIRLPFLALPLVFYWIPWREKNRRMVMMLALTLIFCASTYVSIQYWMHYDAWNELLKSGSPIPVPMQDHIRYAQLQAFILISGIYWLKCDTKLGINIRRLFWFALAGIFFFIHLLAVRSGLLIAYSGLLVLFLLNIFEWKKWQVLVGIFLLSLIAFSTIYFIPSLKAKVNYMIWDIRTYQEGEHLNNSDSGRWISYEAGLKLWKQNKLFGIGPGDMDNALEQLYKKDYPNEANYKQPHNQFLNTMVASGILGLVIFIIIWLMLFVFGLKTNNPLLCALTIATIASFMVESPLETARGTALIGFWLSLWMRKFDADEI